MALLLTADNSEHKTLADLHAHLRRWLTVNPEKGREWAIEYLRARRAEKDLVYAPSQTELRSLYCPSMAYYDSIGSYYSITRALGYQDRYLTRPISFVPLRQDARFICDTREQKALQLPYAKREKLEFGDYALAAPYDKGIRIERKSLADFFGTLTSKKVVKVRLGEDSACRRFERELIRAQEGSGYVIMMVEASLKEALAFNNRFGSATIHHVFKNLRDLLTKYPLHFQACFANDPVDAAAKVVRLFEMGEQVRTTDLQYALEKGEF